MARDKIRKRIVSNNPLGGTATQANLLLKEDKLLPILPKTDNYTLTAADKSKILTMDAGTNKILTLPNNSDEPIPVGFRILCDQLGEGKIVFLPATGVTLTSYQNGDSTAGQFARGHLHKVATNTWWLNGELTLTGYLAITETTTPFDESTLNGAVIMLTVTNTTFTMSPTPGNYTLNNAPAGVSLASVAYISPTQVALLLAYDGTDFDVDVTNMSVTVAGSEMGVASPLTTQTITASALVEVLTASPNPTSLTEANLNGAIITLNLANEIYVPVVNIANINLINAPTGTTIASINRVGDTQLEVTLAYNGTDFDSNVTNFALSVNGTELSRGNGLTSQNLTITSLTESIAVITTNPTSLNEGNINEAVITVELTNEVFVTLLTAAKFALVNAPTGVTISGVNRLNNTQAEITLAFAIGNDFDADVTNFAVTALGTALSRGNALTTGNLTITALVEALLATPAVALTEANLDGAEINLLITNEAFADNTINTAYITLNNAPAGVTVAAVLWTSPTTATVTLAYDNTDFDEDVTNFSIVVEWPELTRQVALTSNTMTITAVIEASVLATPSVTMTEETITTFYIDLDLTGRVYAAAGSLSLAHFTLNNAPTGLTVYAKNRISNTKVRIGLYYPGADFDSSITNFSVTVAGAAFNPTSTPLTSQDMVIAAVIEPTVYSLPYSQPFGINGTSSPGFDYNLPPQWSTDSPDDISVYAAFVNIPNCDVTGSSDGPAVNFLNTLGTVEYLVTAPFNTTGLTNITVGWNEFRNAGAPVLTVEWSTDGSTWNAVTYAGVTDDDAWHANTPIVLPAGANNQATLYIRIGQASDGLGGLTGIDDFSISGT